ncbi:hypothetical protein [uncultured Roseobacter sp.]|uniref:hypothetical protein n=1 Tax=uncultured Roseobacter sp. TaxID=114847 RepID=UPI002610E7CA|nr:hypothetical protein [uncultured Roseobacter sp.]
MTEFVAITGLSRVANPKPNRGGSIIIAYFDCTVRGVELKGCALVRTKAKGLVAWPPNLETADNRRAVRIADDSLRHGMMMHAREAYRALGGTDAEQIGKSIPMRPRAVS